MTSGAQSRCPGCGHRGFSAPYRLARQPTVLNYRFPSAHESLKVRRRDICLVQCRHCGLIFNRTFESEDVLYDENYDNRQCFTPAFAQHLEQVADDLTERWHLRHKRILEVGCGKGDFLRLLCRRSGSEGVGYDTSYQGRSGRTVKGVRFYRSYVSAKDITDRFDAVICRHVIEHVGPIGAFLRELHAIARACGEPVTLLETPSFEWIAKNVCFWDVFYEHCNYFSLPCLAYLSGLAGFEIADQRLAFGGQYQILVLKVTAEKGGTMPLSPAVSKDGSLSHFAKQAETQLQQMETRLVAAGARKGWAIWGAGAKGVSLVNRLRRLPPQYVIDSNPAKQGGVVPGSKVSVIAPNDARILPLHLILIANPNYADEIKAVLTQRGYQNQVLTL
jgi:SAM-dependent methyltransferase